MPLHVDVKRRLTTRSDRVKSLDLHPTEPWLLVSLYNGKIHVWDIEQQQLAKTIEVCPMPVRCGKFISRKFWMVFGSDDMCIHVYNYNTQERVKEFEAHTDYIRSILVHPTHPYIITSSDDMTIKLWDWDQNWKNILSFEGHSHYVMNLALNPKDNNTFASASLDKTIKVWNIGSSRPNFSLEGHQKGVNFVDYYSLGDKPYLASGSDDRSIKIWDYQTKTCVQTLTGHVHNISFVVFHSQLPLLLSGSEDGTVNLWHSGTYRLETTLSYGMERAWCAVTGKSSYQNMVAIGYDEGAIVVSLGKDEPSISMDKSGKIICARHCEVLQANIKSMLSTMDEQSIKDGERLSTPLKELGTCDIYPQSIQHNSNGRFVVICGDGEYVVHTAMALRNKSYGQAFEFVWCPFEANNYAIRETSQKIKLFVNFKEQKSINVEFPIDAIYSGYLIGVKGAGGLSFYNWTDGQFVRRIDIKPESVYWNDASTHVAICTKDEFFILRFNLDRLAEKVDGEELEDAFELLENGQIQESVLKGIWYGEAFIFQNTSNKLKYYIGGEVVSLAQLEKGTNLIGFMAKENRVFLVDSKLQLISYQLYQSILEYESAIIEENLELAESLLPSIPKDQWKKIAVFLEKQGHSEMALQVTSDPDHKFDLAINLGDLDLAFSLLNAETQQDGLEEKWKTLAELACKKSNFDLAQKCLFNCKDLPSLLLLASCSGSLETMQKVSDVSQSENLKNLYFLSNFLLGDLDKCLDILIASDRLPEAAFFSRAYCPSRASEVVKKWQFWLKENTKTPSDLKIAESIADPYANKELFLEFEKSLFAEKKIKAGAANRLKMHPMNYPKVERGWENDIDIEIDSFTPKEAPIPKEDNEPALLVPQARLPEQQPILSSQEPVNTRTSLSVASSMSNKTSASKNSESQASEDPSVDKIEEMMQRVSVEMENNLNLGDEKNIPNFSEKAPEEMEEENTPEKDDDININLNWTDEEDDDENYE